MRPGTRGTLTLVDAIFFVAVVAVAAAVVLAAVPPPAPDSDDTRYARSVLQSLLEVTIGPFTVARAGEWTEIGRGPASEVLVKALRLDLAGAVPVMLIGVRLSELLEPVVREGRTVLFLARATDLAGGRAMLLARAPIEVDPGWDAGPYVVAETVLELGDPLQTRVTFAVRVYAPA